VTSLSDLLTGKALDVYSTVSKTAAVDYKVLKEALLKRYDLTENGFRVRFRNSKPEDGESPDQFITRLKLYLTRWIDLAKTEKSFEALWELFVKEQLIDACPEDLAIYLLGLSNCLVLFKIFHMYIYIFIIPCLIVLNMVNTSPGKTKDSVKVVDTLR
jgi:hypothetical protein